MLDIESMISAQRVMTLKKYFAYGNSSWKTILDEFSCNVGDKIYIELDETEIDFVQSNIKIIV